jgi:hypothetical protein
MLARQTLRFLSLCAIGALLIVPAPACGQAEEAPPPATHSEWAVGVQLSPVFGLSVRWAATSRFTLQAAGLPGLGGNFQGTVGGRGLYKFAAQDSYNVYGSLGGAVYVRKALGLRSSEIAVQTEVNEAVIAVIGAETAIGDHVGLSGEGGIGYMWWDESTLWIPSFGIGLHYYWE